MIMRKLSAILLVFLSLTAYCQEKSVKIMPVGVFHFDFPNLDVVKTAEEDKISVLDEPFQSQILAIARELSAFRPTLIACEFIPSLQRVMDSLYALYREDQWELKAGEDYQLGFRIAKDNCLDRVYGVDDPGRHYSNVLEIFNDPARLSRFEKYYLQHHKTNQDLPGGGKISDIVRTLIDSNQPQYNKERLAGYLVHPFDYEEEPGDFTGVDFESGRWFNRNLRILRNIQRLPFTSEDRILLIIGSDHLNLLNWFLEVSPQFELVSPLPYLEKAGKH